MIATHGILVLTALATINTATAGRDEATSPLDGKWTTALGPLRDIPASLEIAEGRATLSVGTSSSQKVKTTGAIQINQVESLYRIEWTGIVGPDGSAVEDRKGLARRSGNVLHLALGEPGGERPTSFEPTASRYPTVWTLWLEGAEDEAAVAKAVDGELANLQGTWGGTFGPGGAFSVDLKFEGDQVRLTLIRQAGQESTIAGTVRIVENDGPKAMDWVAQDPETGEDRAVKSIYEINGDTMRLHANLRGGDRPASFEEGRGTITLTRRKPDGE